jgi:hypothetical protein
VQALWQFWITGQFVAAEHTKLRLGELGQPPANFSPNVNSFSGLAHVFGRVQGTKSAPLAVTFTGAGGGGNPEGEGEIVLADSSPGGPVM